MGRAPGPFPTSPHSGTTLSTPAAHHTELGLSSAHQGVYGCSTASYAYASLALLPSCRDALGGCVLIGYASYLWWWFRYKYPSDYNPADYLLDVLSSNPDNDPASEATRMDSVVKAFASTPCKIHDPLPCTNEYVPRWLIENSPSSPICVLFLALAATRA